MKRTFALLLTLALLLTAACAFASCGGEGDGSSATSSVAASSTASSASSSSASSASSASSSDASSAASSAASSDASSATSSDTSSDTTSGGSDGPEFLNNFLSFGPVDVKVTAASDNSVRLTGIDEGLAEGAIVLYTPDCEETPTAEELADFAVALFDFDHSVFGYVKTGFQAVGQATDLEVPDDGFAVAAHKSQDVYVKRLESLEEKKTTVFPHGLHLPVLDYTVKKATASPSIDGNFDESEWSAYRIDDVDAENDLWSYDQFDKNDYYATGRYYVTYDDEYLYLCVVVSSPYHYCPIEKDKANDMWQYECIQVKVSAEAPDGEYILENFDHASNNKAVSDGVLHAYGFAANDNNETCFYETGKITTFPGIAGCSRDDSAQQTVYEVGFPWSELELTPEAGLRLGLSFSINSTNAEDFSNGVFKNIIYRCGGGVIGRNDWSKIPVITLS